MATMTNLKKAASMLLLYVVLSASSSSRSSSSSVSASSVAASSRALARREALLRAGAGSSMQSALDTATKVRTRRKRAAMARRGGGAVVVAGDASSSSSTETNLDERDQEFDFSAEELLLEQEFQRQLDLEFLEDETESSASSVVAAVTATAKPAAATAAADSSFTSTYSVPPAGAATAATEATTTAAVSPPPLAASKKQQQQKQPLDDILVVINTPHYLGDGYAQPVDGCTRKVEKAESSSPLSSSSSSTSSSNQKTIPLRCEFSADTAKAKQAQALWYHLPTTGPSGPYSSSNENDNNPFTTRPATEQVAVAATMESAAYYPNILDPSFMKHFAVESSYRLRSEAMLMYFSEPHVQLWTNLSSIRSFKEKKAAIGYVSSNCGAPSGRDGIVGKLMDMTAAATITGEEASASSSLTSSSSSSSSSSSFASSGAHGSHVPTVAAGSAGFEFATKLLEQPHLLTELQREQLLRQVGGSGAAGGAGAGVQQQQQQQQPLQPQQQHQHHRHHHQATTALPVHSFGRCRSNMPPAPMGGQVAVMRDYRFCIAIENSVAEDYVTEKVYAALDAGCLPVYYGAPNGLDFVPVPESVIDYRALGGTPEALMAEIVRLNNDEQAYEAKMAWRKAGPAGWSPEFLALRERANEMSGQCAVCLKVAEALERNREEKGEKEEERKGLSSGSASATATTAATNAGASSSSSSPVNHMAVSRRFIDGFEQEVPTATAAAATAERSGGEVRM